MSLNSEPNTAVRPPRPPTVDYAVYALLARCVFAIAGAFAIYGARPEVTAAVVKLHPDWTVSQVHDNVDSGLKANFFAALITTALVLVLTKFIRDGRSWSRWLYLITAFFVTRDVLQVTGLFQYHALAYRATSGLTGLAAIAALVLLFLPASSAYLRRPGSQPALTSLFRPKSARLIGNQSVDTVETVEPVVLQKPKPKPKRPAGQRPPVRAKSRRSGTE
jgi:hypothetical protein